MAPLYYTGKRVYSSPEGPTKATKHESWVVITRIEPRKISHSYGHVSQVKLSIFKVGGIRYANVSCNVAAVYSKFSVAINCFVR